MTARDELLDALLRERYNGGGWRPTHTQAEIEADDELSAARRRRQMAEDYDRLNAAEREAR